jgi:hypothetical protein
MQKNNILLRPKYWHVECEECAAYVVGANPAHEPRCPNSKYMWFYDELSSCVYPNVDYSKKTPERTPGCAAHI